MYGGLTNINCSTCALNTLIQIIAHSPKLYDSLHKSFDYSQNNEEPQKIAWHMCFITRALAESHSVTPGGLVTLLYKLFPDNFRRGEQMDIHELWILLADKITDEVGTNKKPKITHPQNINTDISTKVTENLTKINHGKVSAWLNSIQCIQLGVLKCNNPACGDTPWNMEVYNSIEVDIPHKKSGQNGQNEPIILDHLLQQNHLIENMYEWKCEKCNNIGGIKQTQMYALPCILMIMVKRFRMSSNGSFKKINTPINISQQINIGINGVTSKYNLVGIGNHYGVYGGGHYTAHVLENNNWMCCDDIHRSVIDISQDNIFVNNTSAYIVCYELV